MTTLSVPGVAETIYSYLGPIEKKALSVTCKDMRTAYMRTYFPRGLAAAPMRLSADSYWGGDGEASHLRRCGAPGCPRRASPTTNIMGMKTRTSIGMLTHCGRPRCREAVVMASYKRALEALLTDCRGEGWHMDATARDTLLGRAIAAAQCYSRVRAVHDALVGAMIKHLLGPHPSQGQSCTLFGGDMKVEDVLLGKAVVYVDSRCATEAAISRAAL